MKSPEQWSQFTWLLLATVSIFSGIVSWSTNISISRPFSRLFNALIDIITSGFVCSLVFMLLDAYDNPVGVSAAIGGICGHMSTRFLFIVENAIIRKVGEIVGDNDEVE